MERQTTEMTISINWSVQLVATYQWFLRKPPSVHVVELAGRPRHYNVTSPGTGWLNRSHWASWRTCDRIRYDIDGLMQNCSISNALALEILQSCTKPRMLCIRLNYSDLNFYMLAGDNTMNLAQVISGSPHLWPKQGKSEGLESCDRPIVRKRPIWVKIGDVLSRVTLKFDGWPWKTIGHLSFAV